MSGKKYQLKFNFNDGTSKAVEFVAPQGPKGDNGSSVSITSTSSSDVDGGNNVITFSDGKSITIKNGSTGARGPKGDTPDTSIFALKADITYGTEDLNSGSSPLATGKLYFVYE